MQIACNQCIGCRLDKSKEWAIRCMHEAQLHEQNCFITLTYDDDHLPKSSSLDHTDFQKFMKRLRRKYDHKTIRNYMCGEYGENLGRPHFHTLLFGHNFDDRKPFFQTEAGEQVDTSEKLDKIWSINGVSLGHATIMDCTLKSAAYISRYITKKINGPSADDHYKGRKPEYSRMSNRSGIGQKWFQKYSSDIYPGDFAIVDGKKMKTPKYYDRLLEKISPECLEDMKTKRKEAFLLHEADNTPERLATREKIQYLKYELLQRNKL